MLVLTRKCRESIVVGAPNPFERLVKVTVLDIRRGSVKLGFEAETEVAVHRWEIWERILATRPED